MTEPKQIISIHGAPRSGTTWLARLLSLDPNTTFRYQPFFSYAFKGRLSTNSSPDEIKSTVNEIFSTKDPFVLQQGDHSLAPGIAGPAKHKPTTMIMKSVRYHELMKPLLTSDQRIKVLAIVRHPCAVINSWLRTPREFKSGWQALDEWKDAPKKNLGSDSEYWGFERWLHLTHHLMNLEKEFPKRVQLVRYEHLVDSLIMELQQIASWAGLDCSSNEIINAALSSQTTNDIKHDYSVYKSPSVVSRWNQELEPEIKQAIANRMKPLEHLNQRFEWAW